MLQKSVFSIKLKFKQTKVNNVKTYYIRRKKKIMENRTYTKSNKIIKLASRSNWNKFNIITKCGKKDISKLCEARLPNKELLFSKKNVVNKLFCEATLTDILKIDLK